MEGKHVAESVAVKGQFKRVIFCGLGGSAMPAEMVSMLWLDGLNGYIQREYGLPFWANSETLIVCTSWSGNTEETISSLTAAVAKNIPAVAVTKGGKLAELAVSAGVPLIRLPEDKSPARLGLGYLTGALLTLLHNFAIIDYIVPTGLNLGPAGTSFSSRIGSKIPLIYSSYQWRYLARFWKISFNENSKIHSFSNYFPEAAHNEIAGFQPTKQDFYFPILLVDRSEAKADIEKLEKFANFLRDQGIDHTVIDLAGRSRLEKIASNYSLAISISFELAHQLGVNPLTGSTIETFKQS